MDDKNIREQSGGDPQKGKNGSRRTLEDLLYKLGLKKITLKVSVPGTFEETFREMSSFDLGFLLCISWGLEGALEVQGIKELQEVLFNHPEKVTSLIQLNKAFLSKDFNIYARAVLSDIYATCKAFIPEEGEEYAGEILTNIILKIVQHAVQDTEAVNISSEGLKKAIMLAVQKDLFALPDLNDSSSSEPFN